ncbi:hypothetical protein KJ636_00790 [Patescibacteria group bacterium]|nr:hypothetical protein [Patescibacteria group bacterium]
MRRLERGPKPKIEIRKEKEGKPEKMTKEVPEKRKESYREIISGKLRKLTEMIEKATLERMLINPDAPATEKDFDKLDRRLTGEAEILAKRYKMGDEIDESGEIIKKGDEKILETIGYDYDEKKKYEGARKGDLNLYERNALFKMWNLPAEEKDIEEFKKKIRGEIDKLAETKKIKKEEIEKAVHFEEIDYKGSTKEELLFLEYATHFDLNRLEINKKGEIELPPFLFLESPKAEWLKTAFAIGLPTLLLFSAYSGPGMGKEKPVSIKELKENPDLLDKVYKEEILKLIAHEGDATVELVSPGKSYMGDLDRANRLFKEGKINEETRDKFERFLREDAELRSDNTITPIKLRFMGDAPYLQVDYTGQGVAPEYLEEMNKIGLHIDAKNSNIPLSFYLKHRNEVDKIISKHYKIYPGQMNKMDTLIKIDEITEKRKDMPILSWKDFSVGKDTSENIKKINDYRELLKEGKTEAVLSYGPNFTDAIDKLFQKEGYDDDKLKEIAEKNPKEVIGVIAEIIEKNVKYDVEAAVNLEAGGGMIVRFGEAPSDDRYLTKILESGGVCEDISNVVTATVEYMKSKGVLPQNLLVTIASSRFMNHAFNSVLTVDSSGKLVSTYIDVTRFDPKKEKAEKIDPELIKERENYIKSHGWTVDDDYFYDLSAVDYYHQLGLSKKKIKKIMTARFSEYAKLIQDITTYDPWLHKKEREIKIEKGK